MATPTHATVPAAPQRLWGVSHATWFTLMGVGGGVFLLPRLTGAELGRWLGIPLHELISFISIGVGGVVLVAHLGRPERILRAFVHPRTSWISRGAIADVVFLLAGALLVLPDLFAGLPWARNDGSAFALLLELLADVSALVVIWYAGQVLAVSRAIPSWSSLAVPLQYFLSSLATSQAIVLLLEVSRGVEAPTAQLVAFAVSLIALAAVVAWHLDRCLRGSGRAGAEALLRGRYRSQFLLVVLLGLAVPLGAAGAAGAAPVWCAGVMTLATLASGFWWRLLTLRAGFFANATVEVPQRGWRRGRPPTREEMHR